jgi:hypothetical protein
LRDLSHNEYRALAEFRYQIRRFLHFSEEQARAGGLEPQQHQLLLTVRGLPRGVDATVGELVDRLERRGCVTRNSGRKDRRQVMVHLTPVGSKVLSRLSLAHHQELEAAGPRLAKALRSLARQHRAKEKQPA